MSEAILEARELHAYYGASHILHGIDFRIDRGETVGLMGRNGMGKSTLIRSMLGIVRPRHGEVFVCGTPMTGAAPFRRADGGQRRRDLAASRTAARGAGPERSGQDDADKPPVR